MNASPMRPSRAPERGTVLATALLAAVVGAAGCSKQGADKSEAAPADKTWEFRPVWALRIVDKKGIREHAASIKAFLLEQGGQLEVPVEMKGPTVVLTLQSVSPDPPLTVLDHLRAVDAGFKGSDGRNYDLDVFLESGTETGSPKVCGVSIRAVNGKERYTRGTEMGRWVRTPLPGVPSPARLTARRYVFVDSHSSEEARVLAGRRDPGMCIDFPTYFFYEQTRSLRGEIRFEINDRLQAIYGSGSSLHGAAGSGAATGLEGVYELPGPARPGGAPIRKIEADGTVHIGGGWIPLILKPGEAWVYTSNWIQQDEQGKTKWTVHSTVINHGILEKADLLKDNPHREIR